MSFKFPATVRFFPRIGSREVIRYFNSSMTTAIYSDVTLTTSSVKTLTLSSYSITAAYDSLISFIFWNSLKDSWNGRFLSRSAGGSNLSFKLYKYILQSSPDSAISYNY